MSEAGYYRTNYRALRLRELVRLRGPLRLPLTWVLTRLVLKPKGGHWMPELAADAACAPEELSARIWELTAPPRAACEKLGFSLIATARSKHNLDPNHVEGGELYFVHANRAHTGQLFCIRQQLPPPLNRLRETLVITFTAAFARETLVVTNHGGLFDPVRDQTRVVTPAKDVAGVHAVFAREVRRRSEAPRVFTDLAALQAWRDERNVAAFEERVQRGLFVRMTDAEVEQAKKALGRKTP